MTGMKQTLMKALSEAVEPLGIDASSIRLEYPEDPSHGDFSSNIAMANAKKLGMAPKVLAEKVIAAFDDVKPSFIESVSIAGPGFINFKVKDSFFAQSIAGIVENGAEYGWGSGDRGRKIMVEYTDPNTFKVFHIGHLMSNAIGESLSRLIEASGAKVVRICYPSDIGLHIAKSIWAIQKHEDEIPSDSASIQERTAFLGKMYVEGTQKYEADPAAKDDIDALNKVIYAKSSRTVNALYEKGRKWSLDHFELLYKTLGTKFDGFIYESDMAPKGLEIVRSHIGKVFEESEGAVVFKGEQYGLHTRVFINSLGLPTYEAKEVGLNVTKFQQHPDADSSIIVTASEQNDYFKVLLKVLALIDEKNREKTKRHIGHGMMRFASGKMSSRTGNVITAESLLADIKAMVAEKIVGREFTAAEADEVSEMIAVAAIKYTILRSAVGSDIIFDSSASISFEGDSGPYLQYSAVRANSVLEKAKAEISVDSKIILPENTGLLERLISRFPEVLERARAEYAPQHVAHYLTDLAGAFNSFYASTSIIDKDEPLSPYRIAITKAFLTTMTNGLWVLGIKVPRKM